MVSQLQQLSRGKIFNGFSLFSRSEQSSDTSNEAIDRLENVPVFPAGSSSAKTKLMAARLEKIQAQQNRTKPEACSGHRPATPLRQLPPESPSSNAATLPRLTPHARGPAGIHMTDAPLLDPSGSMPSLHDTSGTESAYEDVCDDTSGTWDRSESISEDNEDDGDDDSTVPGIWRFEEHWRKLRDQRNALKSTFAKIDKQRSDLQDTRQKKFQAYSELDIAIQKVLHQHPYLRDHLDTVRNQELVSQAQETTLDDLLDDLRQGEIQVELEERRFFTNETISRRSSRVSLRGIEGVRPDNVDPLFEEFKDAVKEFYLAQEWSSELILRKRILDSKYPEQWTLDDREFLDDFDADQQEALSEVDHWERAAIRLEKECRERNLIPPSSSLEEQGYWQNRQNRDEITLGQVLSSQDAPGSLPPSRFPLLRSNSKLSVMNTFSKRDGRQRSRVFSPERNSISASTLAPLQSAEEDFHIEPLLSKVGGVEKRAYINRWLLQRLRQSTLEVNLLLAICLSFHDVRDRTQWQRDVLNCWPRDGAATQEPIANAGANVHRITNLSDTDNPQYSSHSALLEDVQPEKQGRKRTVNITDCASAP
ncbi:hypothetical protein SCAR479_09131 [Seiridium cardinale]|uniref:Uncharacterized protein n=1 Tax=Seiridium cardinale TaxID=138064 RepID=A0ABR2XKB7_9PEZI